MSRTWGYWTRGKLDVLRDYLDAFTTTTKYKAPSERIYLDLFAGETDNRDRITNEEIQSSAQIALSTSNPPFTRLRFFEVKDKARELESSLLAANPGRDIKVYGGDCNEKIVRALAELRAFAWAPTFAFIDPNGLEAKWCTLKRLSKFRTGKYKTELFLLFSPQMFSRILPTRGRDLRPEDEGTIDAVFGVGSWRHIYDRRLDKSLSGEQAREEYLNLMRWRLEADLGYKWTHPLELKNTRGSSLYFMIFATTNPAGHRIMGDLYDRAARQFPAMQAEARRRIQQIDEESSGIMRLFPDDSGLRATEAFDERLYLHEPPIRPSFLKSEPL
ncbi:MAG: three-Cys-motif partner protein TcmP [Acidimicrobiaceae bacterium]|nr:three-Cys-motif partner protein TcmP [Acidimicrobiaceae bacterium]MYL03288.1 three-Cys-motif partner protein TcmP [Acidimicrobiaceae bacterium]